MDEALQWWEKLTPYRKKHLANYHCWSTPDGLTNDSILFIYQQEDSY